MWALPQQRPPSLPFPSPAVRRVAAPLTGPVASQHETLRRGRSGSSGASANAAPAAATAAATDDDSATTAQADKRDKENERAGSEWDRLHKSQLAARLCEAVTALRGTVAENAALRRDREALEVDRDRLRLKAERLECELIEGTGRRSFEDELAHVLRCSADSKDGNAVRPPLRDISSAPALATMHSPLYFDVLSFREELGTLSRCKKQGPLLPKAGSLTGLPVPGLLVPSTSRTAGTAAPPVPRGPGPPRSASMAAIRTLSSDSRLCYPTA